MYKPHQFMVAVLCGMALAANSAAQTCFYGEPAAAQCLDPRVIDGAEGQHMVLMDCDDATADGYIADIYVGNLVYFEVTPLVSGPMTVSTCYQYTQYDTVISLNTRGEFCEFQQLTYSDDAYFTNCDAHCTGYTSQLTYDVTAYVTYVIIVGSYNANPQGCPLCLGLIVTIGEPCGMAPFNITCGTAYEFPGSVGVHEVEIDVTDVPTPPWSWPCSTNVGHVVWFKVTPEQNGPIMFSTCTPTTEYDTVVWVFAYEEEECSPYSLIVSLSCEDDTVASECDNPCGADRGTQVTWWGGAGATTYIMVGAYDDNSVGCTLCLGARLTFLEDTTPPIAEIESPYPMTCVCGSREITGTADDPDGDLDSYTVEYQSASGGDWVNIVTAEHSVIGGTLATWDTTSLSEGYYILRLTTTNAYGLTSNAVRVVWVDRTFQSFDVRYPAYGALVSGDVCVEGTIWDSCFWKYTVGYLPPTGGDFMPVDPSMPEYFSTVLNEPLAHWDTVGLGLENGGYWLLISAWTICSVVPSHTEYRFVSLDNWPPEATITAPTACENVSGVVEVHGIAYDDHLAGWTLQYTGGTETSWVTLATGDYQVVGGGFLANWDTTGLPPCGYTLRLLVTDAAVPGCNSPHRAQSEYLVSVTIGGGGGGESRADVNCDGLIDGLDVQPFVECVLQSECPPCP